MLQESRVIEALELPIGKYKISLAFPDMLPLYDRLEWRSIMSLEIFAVGLMQRDKTKPTASLSMYPLLFFAL